MRIYLAIDVELAGGEPVPDSQLWQELGDGYVMDFEGSTYDVDVKVIASTLEGFTQEATTR